MGSLTSPLAASPTAGQAVSMAAEWATARAFDLAAGACRRAINDTCFDLLTEIFLCALDNVMAGVSRPLVMERTGVFAKSTPSVNRCFSNPAIRELATEH